MCNTMCKFTNSLKKKSASIITTLLTNTTPTMDSNRVNQFLTQLSERFTDRKHELLRFSSTREVESDEEAGAESPIFDSFYNSGGSEAIVKMTNFTPAEFRKLCDILHGTILANWNNGRGKKCAFKAMDVLFMTLVVLRDNSSWDQLARSFSVKVPTFMRLIPGFINNIVDACVTHFVTSVFKQSRMSALFEQDTIFESFPFALKAIDVTFQEANRPSGNMQEGKVYFSGKHKLYGFKVEFAVRPNCLASAFSRHYLGSVSDINIMYRTTAKHQERLLKKGEDEEFEEDYLLKEKYPEHWALLADKGNQGSDEFLRCVTTHKKPKRGVLTREEIEFNKKHSSDRILVENYFGRMGQLWSLLSSKYVWSESTILSSLLGLHSRNSIFPCTSYATIIMSGSIVIRIEWILLERKGRERGQRSSRSIGRRESAAWKLTIEELILQK